MILRLAGHLSAPVHRLTDLKLPQEMIDEGMARAEKVGCSPRRGTLNACTVHECFVARTPTIRYKSDIAWGSGLWGTLQSHFPARRCLILPGSGVCCYSPDARTIGAPLMVNSTIEPVSDRLPERTLETERREAVSRARVEQAWIILQAAERVLLRSQMCLAQWPEMSSPHQASHHHDDAGTDPGDDRRGDGASGEGGVYAG